MHGALHNHGGDSFFQKDKSCIGQKLKLKSILVFYKDLLEIKSCLLGDIYELKLWNLLEKIELKLYSNDCYENLTLRTLLAVLNLKTFVFLKKAVSSIIMKDSMLKWDLLRSVLYLRGSWIPDHTI